MQQFIEKFKDQMVGQLSGFDRLIFRGSLRSLNFGYRDRNTGKFVASGMEEYLWKNHIRFKNFRDHVQSISQRLKQQVIAPLKKQGVPVEFVSDPKASKDAIARNLALKRKVQIGSVCLISAVEPSPTFEHIGTHMIRRICPCHVLYHYQRHAELGWMHARIQTWLPFNIQVGLNGREWLARQMDQTGLGYRQQGNCFVWLEDYERAQALMQRQLETDWAKLLGEFADQLNPIRQSVFEHYPSEYHWTTYQSEWASDLVFQDGAFLKRLMRLLVRHGMLTYGSSDVLRFFGGKVNQSGAIPAYFHGTLETDVKQRAEGERVKYQKDSNRAKFYDKAYSQWGNVLRVETTINTAKDFRVYRPKQGGAEEDLHWLPMRKGVADLYRRAQVSQKCNDRVMDALASVDDSRSVAELTRAIQRPKNSAQGRVRALRPWGDDAELLQAINDGDFFLNGFRNRDIQERLYQTGACGVAERRRRSARVGRLLRLLRGHGLIQKVNRTHRYHVTEQGRRILAAVLTVARTTLNELNRLGAAA